MRSLTPPLSLLITADAVGASGVMPWMPRARSTAVRRRCRGRPRTIAASLLGIGPDPSQRQIAEAAEAGIALSWAHTPLDWQVDGPDALARSGRIVADAVARAAPDILHLNNPPFLPFVDPQLPRIAAAHSCMATWWRAVRGQTLPADLVWHNHATARGLAAADAVLCPSQAFADDVTAIYGALPDLHVVANASRPVMAAPRDQRVLAAPRDQRVLAAARWWDPAKNLAVLDAAAEGMIWPVDIAGPLDDPAGLAVAVSHVTALGVLDHHTLRRRLARAPVFVSLSLYEPFGLAVLEAATAGAALVLSDIPTHRELWEDCALFVDPNDPAAARDAVNRLAGDPVARGRLGLLAMTRSATFSPTRQAEALLALYGGVLARHAGRPQPDASSPAPASPESGAARP
ncbi:glycosyltransferase family 4 protein [Tistrella bauzanensis]